MTFVDSLQTWIHNLRPTTLLIIGILTAAGFYTGKSAKYIKLPSLIGFMVIGLISGPSLLGLLDETLMRKELEARGFTSDEIEDEIDILIENNTIRSKAREVRKDLESLISAEKNSMATQTQEVDATQQQEIEQGGWEDQPPDEMVDDDGWGDNNQGNLDFDTW